ncbi:VIER F-box protein 2 [Tanacetum coccineum]
MYDARQTTILFPSCLNDYYCDGKKGSYGPQFSEAYSYGASHVDNSIPRKEKDPGSFTLPYYINNVCFDNALADLGASVSVMPLSTYLNLGLGKLAHTKLTVELADRLVKYPKGIAENVLVRIGKFVFPVDFIILDMPEDIKVPLILGRPFFSTAHAKIDVFKRKITLRVGEEKIIFKSVKPASSLIKRVYMLCLRERIKLDLEARLMGETLVRYQVNDLMPTIEEGEVIEEFKARNDSRMVNKIYVYPSDFDHDKKISISYAYNLKFSCMIVLEDMDDYRDEEMGDVIFGEPFLREVGIKARRFNRMITIYNGDDEVSEHDKKNGISHTYQKLKWFYKGVLNLGAMFIRDPSMEEWLTSGHVSVHEMECNNGVLGRYGVSAPTLTKDHEGNYINKPYPEEDQYGVLEIWNEMILKDTKRVRMTKVIKREFEKIEDLTAKDVLLTCDTSLEVLNDEICRLRKMDDDLFTYEVEVTNIPCDSNMDDDLERRVSHEADDDMGYDPSDVAFTEWLGLKFLNYKTMDHFTMKALWIYWIRGDDEVKLNDEESSDDEDEVAKVFRIDTNIFNFETPMFKAFKEFNYLFQIDPDLLTKDIKGFKTYEEYKDDWIYEWNRDVPWADEKPWTDTGVWKEPKPVEHTYEPFNYKTRCLEWPKCSWRDDGFCNGGNLPGSYIIRNQLHYQDYEWYKSLNNSALKQEALLNKGIMERLINDDHDDESREELCEIHELPVYNIRRFEMIKYSFGQDEEYVAVKEDEYNDSIRASEDAPREYQEIFRMMDEGWMVTRAESKRSWKTSLT